MFDQTRQATDGPFDFVEMSCGELRGRTASSWGVPARTAYGSGWGVITPAGPTAFDDTEVRK